MYADRRSQLAWFGLLGVTLVACTTPTEDDADTNTASRVIGGQPASEATRYGTVALIQTGSNQPFCTGTLVAPTVVVTAAHCVVEEKQNGKTVEPADRVQIVAGPLDARNPSSDQLYGVSEVIPHAGYPNRQVDQDPDGLAGEDDVAVLLLRDPISSLQPVPILPGSLVNQVLVEGGQVIVSGYGGREGERGTELFGQLYSAVVPFVRRSETEFIAGREGTADTCPGDSGGPAYVEYGGNVYFAGITLRPVVNSRTECGSGGIYTIVPAYSEWIRAQSGIGAD